MFVPTATNYQHILAELRDKPLRYVVRVRRTCSRPRNATATAYEDHRSRGGQRFTGHHEQTFRRYQRQETRNVVADVFDSIDKPERILGISTGYRGLDNRNRSLAVGDRS